MGDTNELMEFLSASLGATLDEIYQRLIDCDFTREDPGLAMFVVALLNALGREGRGNRPTEVVLMLAFGESGTAERGRNRLMRWRRGEMSGHDLAREPGLGEQRDHRLGEMPLPVQPAQPLIGAKRQRDGPGPSHSVDSPTAAPPLKRVRVSEIEIQTSETIETLEKKERDQSELCAKLQEYRAIARERDGKKKFEEPRWPTRRMLLGVTSPITAPRIGAARDAEKRMLKWSGGMEPRFISWNVAAAHTFDFSFPDAWSRKKLEMQVPSVNVDLEDLKIIGPRESTWPS